MTASDKYDWTMIHPKHVVFLKHLAVIVKRWEKRICQTSLFRIGVQHSESPEKFLKRGSVQWALGFSQRRESAQSLDYRSSIEEFTNESVAITGRELNVAKMSSSITRMVNRIEHAYLKRIEKAFDQMLLLRDMSWTYLR